MSIRGRSAELGDALGASGGLGPRSRPSLRPLRWYDRLVNLRSREIRELSIQRLVERFYARRLINNVHRGDYVECMIELALDPNEWRLTNPFTS